jgi:hypothetical protein
VQGAERELQGAELLTVASITECLFAIDMSLTREEATWLWKQALRLDSSESAHQQQQQQFASTHEQSQAITLSSMITVLLTVLTTTSP